MGIFDFDSGGSGQLKVAKQGWIFLAISLPLTITTLALAYAWQYYRERLVIREIAAKDAEREDREGEVVQRTRWRARIGDALRRRQRAVS